MTLEEWNTTTDGSAMAEWLGNNCDTKLAQSLAYAIGKASLGSIRPRRARSMAGRCLDSALAKADGRGEFDEATAADLLLWEATPEAIGTPHVHSRLYIPSLAGKLLIGESHISYGAPSPSWLADIGRCAVMAGCLTGSALARLLRKRVPAQEVLPYML